MKQATNNTLGLVPAGLAMVAVTYGLARFAYGLFLPELREAFELDAAVLGLIGSGSYVGYCVAITISLIYTSKVGPRFMVAAAGATAVVGMSIIAAAPSVPFVAAGVLIAGSSTGLASPPMAEAVSRVFDGTRQDRANRRETCEAGLRGKLVRVWSAKNVTKRVTGLPLRPSEYAPGF